MKLAARKSPFIRKNVSVKRMMLDVIIALLPLVLFAMIQNGWNGAYVILLSVVVMILVDLIAVGLMKWPDGMKRRELFTKEGFKKLSSQYNINNILTPIISGLIFALLLPASTPAYVIIVGAIVGNLFGKLVFGPYGSNIFNPAAVGFIFVSLCFSNQLTAAINHQSALIFPELVENGVITGGTPLNQLTNINNLQGAMGIYSIKNLFFGQVPGAMGEVCTLLIIVSFIYLAIRRSIDLRASLSMLLSFILITLCVGIVVDNNTPTNILDFVLYELLAGGFLFAVVFMVTDPVTSPTTKFGRVFYGAFIGIMVAFIRFIGAYPEGTAYAILLGNTIASAIDYFMRGKPNTYTWKQILTLSIVMIVACVVLGLAVNNQLSAKTATSFILGGI